MRVMPWIMNDEGLDLALEEQQVHLGTSAANTTVSLFQISTFGTGTQLRRDTVKRTPICITLV